ncbi:MAG TPA: VTT domain-containing protein [Usitatibacter sp.]|jgi:phosphatidylserine/phosphatidylglycerophosphate/cardiolipin synthase-like enzyme/uncharacterized membrane protein YdjX (TVP38/TMEM64 family)|nr:VTT domain-containing protein [Usitatibacter sp.]
MTDTLFEPGRNCTSVANAPRVAFIVDAEDYFRAFMLAAEKAQRSITIVGWDFDSRTPLCNEDDKGGGCVRLGEFLNRLAAGNRHLRIRILNWDYPMVFGADRELPPTLGISWTPHRRVDFRFDDTHPVGGSHHQKIVVIDDRIAFSGGLDLTNKRWDTRSHTAADPRRIFDGKPYPPFHDSMMAVDGEAACALARIAYGRWHDATGEVIAVKPHAGRHDPWPGGLEPDAHDARVAVSRTAPPFEDYDGLREVEALYLDMIARARRYLYIENQYFTSDVIGAALKRSLARPDGPEILVVTRLLSHGWLEELTMTNLRTRLVRELRAADVHGRLHVVYPQVHGLAEGTCLDVHSKICVVDDEWLRIGSANLSNRSMGMDTECDVTLEAGGDATVARAVRRFRDCLVAEHSGCTVEEVERAIAQHGSLNRAVHALGDDKRRLLPLDAPELPASALLIAEIGDPAEPLFEQIVPRVVPERRAAKRFPLRRFALVSSGIIVLAFILALVWTRTPLASWVTLERAAAWADWFTGRWWAPILVVAAYTPAAVLMFPRWIITIAAVMAFGPWRGFALGTAGMVIAAILTFLPGRIIGRERVQRFTGPRLRRIAHFLHRRGLLAVMMVRIVPVAPFPVVNLAMGALRVPLRHFVLGTLVGIMPGMLAATVLSDQLAAALEEPSSINAWAVAAGVLIIGMLAFFAQRVIRRVPA